MTTTAHTRTAAVDWEDPSRSVVVGVDGSERNNAAVAWATEQASESSRPLTLLHVVDDYTFPIPHRSMSSDAERGCSALDRVRKSLTTSHPALKVRHEIACGATVSSLLDRSVDQSMLVVGTRGLSAIARTMIGSTSIGAAGRSRVPIVIVPDTWRQTDHSDEPVVVGIDPDEVHDQALRFAFDHARRRGVGVHLVYAVDPDPALLGDVRMTGFHERAAKLGGDRVEDALLPFRGEFPDVPVRHSEVRGSPESAVLEAGANGQMIVLGRKHTSRTGFPLGSVTRSVLHHSTVPVTVVPLR